VHWIENVQTDEQIEQKIKFDLTGKLKAPGRWDYAQLRQGAITKWNEQQETLRQRRTALLKELPAPDALSLRRMEREQVMFLVLQWLFPDFRQSPSAYENVDSSKADWQTFWNMANTLSLCMMRLIGTTF
jgi:hypothetical protein